MRKKMYPEGKSDEDGQRRQATRERDISGRKVYN